MKGNNTLKWIITTCVTAVLLPLTVWAADSTLKTALADESKLQAVLAEDSA